MKKLTCYILSAALAATQLAGCGSAASTETAVTPEPTAEETTTYETVSDTLIAGPYALVNELILARGDTVVITGEEGDYYRIENSSAEGAAPVYVKKAYIRTETAANTAEPYTVYAKSDVQVYPSAEMLQGTELLTAAMNTEFTVNDEFNGMLYVSWTDSAGGNVLYGYMKSDDTSTSYISANWSDWSGGSGGDGGYGGEGGDISVDSVLDSRVSGNGVTVPLMILPQIHAFRLMESEGKLPDSGTCFSDDIPTYSAILDRGDTVDVITSAEVIVDGQTTTSSISRPAASGQTSGAEDSSAGETADKQTSQTVQILVNDYIGELPEYLLLSRQENPEFAAYDAYIQNKVTWYKSFDMKDEGEAVDVNTPVRVVGLINGAAIVECEDPAGSGDLITRYVLQDQVSTEQYVSSWGDWGGDSGGGDGGSMEWTDPVM